jgi:chemotaxis protein CheY-P-specific phosphatase CheC
MEMKCIFDIGNISIRAKVSQLSDMAHGPLVLKVII